MRRLLILSVCVVAFGATAFGATINVPKDYDTIQEAVDNAENGDVIKVKKGTYRETVEIALLEDITLKAAGKVVIDGENTRDTLRIGLASDVRVIGFTILNSGGPGIYVAGAESVTISKCRIAGTDEAGILVSSCRNLLIDGCSIGDTDEYGIEIFDESGAPASMACTVQKCRFDETGDAAIMLGAGSGHRAEKNRIRDPNGDGIYVMAPGSTCAKNRIDGAHGDGITVYTDDVVVEKNRVKNADSYGIYIHGDDSHALKNQVKTCRLAGFRIRGTRNVAEKNQVRDCGTGFRIDEGGNEIIRNKAKKCDEAVEDAFPNDNTYEKNSFDPPA